MIYHIHCFLSRDFELQHVQANHLVFKLLCCDVDNPVVLVAVYQVLLDFQHSLMLLLRSINMLIAT